MDRLFGFIRGGQDKLYPLLRGFLICGSSFCNQNQTLLEEGLLSVGVRFVLSGELVLELWENEKGSVDLVCAPFWRPRWTNPPLRERYEKENQIQTLGGKHRTVKS